MTVKELLIKFNGYEELLFNSFMEYAPPFYPYERDTLTPEQLKIGMDRYHEMFLSFLKKLNNIETTQSNDVLFVTKNVGTFFGDKDEINSWVCHRDEILEKAGKEFSLWNGDTRIEHYAYDMSPLNEILSYEVFIYEVQEMEALSEILSELTFFGMEENIRNGKIDEIVKSLEEQTKQIEDGTIQTIPAEEVFEELRQEILQNASEEEREAILKEEEEKKKNEGRDDAYMHTAMNINHIQCIKAVMEYYRHEIMDGKIQFS